jgi:polyphenol oxidase
MVEVVQIEAWRQYGWLRHGFGTRSGGFSTVYGGMSLNLGWTKEDDPALIVQNRARFLHVISGILSGNCAPKIVTLRQVHEATVHEVGVEAREGRLETSEGRAVLEGDGLVTDVPGVMLAVGTADCVPVLVVDVEKRAVGAFHAGWRGTVARIAEKGVAAMRERYGSRVEDLVAAVGPSIGVCCYAVGSEVREAFGGKFGYADELFRSFGDAMHVDLWEANRRQLLAAGVGADRITVVGECTACARDDKGERKYFSHRADRGVAGRMLSAVGVAEE